MHIVIIGNSAAAVGCIEGIRKNNQEADITVISNETHHTYSRPLISYLLYGKTDEQRMKYRPDSFYEENRVTAVLGKSVVRIDKDNKKVELDDGQIVAYDKLLVATGSKPFVPPMKGLDSVEKQFTFMTLNDAKALEAALFPSASVLVVGAGLIGLKCVEGIRDKVASVTVVDMADRILPSILDAEGSALVQKSIEQKGVKFILSNSVKEFKGNTAFLTNDDILNFDIVVVAVGVRPNAELVKEIGGDVNRGIITDERCHTSIPDIYAAGDCTESYDITVNQHRILALLPNAYMQGESAGIAIAGGQKPFNQAMPMNSIGFFGLHMITAGVTEGEMLDESREGSYKKLFVKDGRLVGYILIGDVARAGIYTALIREQTSLSTLDFALIAQRPQLMAFSRQVRQQKLGGFR